MPDPTDTDHTPPTDARPGRTGPGRWAVLLPAATFLVGAVLGGLVVGVGDVGEDSDSSDRPTTSAPPAASPSPGGTAVVVPAACSQVADAADKTVTLLREGVGYVRDFQPKKLTQVLDELETADAELRTLAARCSQVDVSSVAPTDSASPTG